MNVLETLFSMGRPHVTLLEDPEVCIMSFFSLYIYFFFLHHMVEILHAHFLVGFCLVYLSSVSALFE